MEVAAVAAAAPCPARGARRPREEGTGGGQEEQEQPPAGEAPCDDGDNVLAKMFLHADKSIKRRWCVRCLEWPLPAPAARPRPSLCGRRARAS
jgi:hypothetical protein